jgi:hypothetical protein
MKKWIVIFVIFCLPISFAVGAELQDIVPIERQPLVKATTGAPA